MNIIETNWTWNGALNNRPRTLGITLHHADAVTASAADVHSWHRAKGWTGIGYHYYIRKDGSIYRGRPEAKQGAHATPVNAEAIGICFEGKYHDIDKVMPAAQLEAGQALIADIQSRYNGKLYVKGHRDVDATACPGQYFPFAEIIKKVEGKKVKRLIIYFGDADRDAAMILRRKYGGYTVRLDDYKKDPMPFDHAFVVGGTWKPEGNVTMLTGANGDETNKTVMKHVCG